MGARNRPWDDERLRALAGIRNRGATRDEAAAELGCGWRTISRRWADYRELQRRRGLDDPGPWMKRKTTPPIEAMGLAIKETYQCACVLPEPSDE